jgi:formate hydrogenlyase subunit 6/NADH:ubiquinone oxidoreductase subunit I
MGSFNLGTMTFGSLFKEPETIQYPAQHRYVPEGLKGHVENTIENCIMCGICEKRCPADAIVVDRSARSWSINRFQCVQCGNCVRECPQKCLRMEPTYAKAAACMSVDTVVQAGPSEEEKAAKEAEKAARIEAALKKKAEKENDQAQSGNTG